MEVNNMICHECQGYGDVYYHCPICAGTGEGQNDHESVCLNCNGKGDVLGKCETCNGTGNVELEIDDDEVFI
jgi:DnaJ-class molecular chaperone